MEVDSIQHGYAARRQQELVGFRVLATQAHNLHRGQNDPSLSERAYMPLPLVDPVPRLGPQTVGGETEEQYRARVTADARRKLEARQQELV